MNNFKSPKRISNYLTKQIIKEDRENWLSVIAISLIGFLIIEVLFQFLIK